VPACRGNGLRVSSLGKSGKQLAFESAPTEEVAMNSLEYALPEGVERETFLAHRSTTHETILDAKIAAGRITVEEGQKGFLSTAERMLVEVLFEGEVQSPKTTGRYVISADAELGLIVFYEAKDPERPGVVKTDGDKLLRFAKLGKVEIRRKA
jgi:hypothetical protein